MDKEAINFFINSATAKIWRHAFVNEVEAVRQLFQLIGVDALVFGIVGKVKDNAVHHQLVALREINPWLQPTHLGAVFWSRLQLL